MSIAATIVVLITLLASVGTASAACPTFETVTGSNGQDTLTGTLKKATAFRGRGGADRFNVEEPRLFSHTGCTQRDYWDKILDYQDREVISVPGTVDSYFISGCYVYWHRSGTASNVRYFVGLNRCNIAKSLVVIR